MILNGASSSELEPTGERFHPAMRGAIRYEHLHRYALCLGLVEGLDVLDIASGEGYGSALLASRARKVIGVDVEPRAVEHARRSYYRPNARYLVGDCAAIPLADASVDVVVSFETLEHVDGHDVMLSEIRRVLRPGGRLVISSPNKLVYSDESGYANPFHVHELYYDEFLQLLERHFPHVRLHGQRLAVASFVYPLAERLAGDLPSYGVNGSEARAGLPVLDRPVYFIAVCGDAPLDAAGIGSLFVDAHDDLLQLLQDEHARALRRIRAQPEAPALEQLTAERDAIAANRESIAAHRDALEANRASIAAHRDAVEADRASIAAHRDALLAGAEAAAQAVRERDEISADRMRLQRRLDAALRELHELRERADAYSAERDAAAQRAEAFARERDKARTLAEATAKLEEQLAAAAAERDADAVRGEQDRLEREAERACLQHRIDALERERTEHDAERGHLQSRLDAALLDLEGANALAEVLRAERDAVAAQAAHARRDAGAERARLQSRLDAMVVEMQRLGERVDALGKERDEFAAGAAREASVVRGMLASRSWRLTAALRALAKPLK